MKNISPKKYHPKHYSNQTLGKQPEFETEKSKNLNTKGGKFIKSINPVLILRKKMVPKLRLHLPYRKLTEKNPPTEYKILKM